MKIKITQKITYLEAKKIQENQPEITFAKVVQSLNRKNKQKKPLLSLMKKILSFNQIQKSLLLLQKLNLNQHLPISLDHKQDLHLKPVHKHSQTKQVNHKRDPSQGQQILKKKNGKEKQKDNDKGPNPYSKGASADPIKLVNRYESLENMELETDSSMFSHSEKIKGLSSFFFKSSLHSSWIKINTSVELSRT